MILNATLFAKFAVIRHVHTGKPDRPIVCFSSGRHLRYVATTRRIDTKTSRTDLGIPWAQALIRDVQSYRGWNPLN